VREKERGTIEQLLVSPLSPLQIVLAKVLAMAGVVLIGSLVAVGLVMRVLLGVPIAGSAPLFFALVALYAMTASGLGIVAATYARSSGQVGLIVLLLVMPIIMLSGTWNLRESMPGWLQAAIYLSPLRYMVDIAYRRGQAGGPHGAAGAGVSRTGNGAVPAAVQVAARTADRVPVLHRLLSNPWPNLAVGREPLAATHVEAPCPQDAAQVVSADPRRRVADPGHRGDDPGGDAVQPGGVQPGARAPGAVRGPACRHRPIDDTDARRAARPGVK